MTYQEALTYIHSNFWMGSKPGLERTEVLLEKLGNPQNKLRLIHVAGTNGKGSFCSMIASVLQETGLKVGLYTSPYILRFNERMQINSKEIEDETLAELVEFIRPFAEQMEEKPTEFELITALAMTYFAQEECDLVVLECGMGGRLDSTNIINSPILSVITGISLDHTSFLGNTVEAIAAEKAGIIKEGVPVLFCGSDLASEKVIAHTAKEKNAPFHKVNREILSVKEMSLHGTIFSYEGEDYRLPLLGQYQPLNAANVLTALKLLEKEGFDISPLALRRGFHKVHWPARFEKVLEKPLMICDGGHNEEGVLACVKSIKQYFGEEKVLILTGCMKDKDYGTMVDMMGEIACHAYCITPDNPRALRAEDLQEVFTQKNIPATAHATVKSALEEALARAEKENRPLLSLGSLYMYSQVIEALKQWKQKK